MKPRITRTALVALVDKWLNECAWALWRGAEDEAFGYYSAAFDLALELDFDSVDCSSVDGPWKWTNIVAWAPRRRTSYGASLATS